MMSLLSLPGRGLAMGPLAVHFLAPLNLVQIRVRRWCGHAGPSPGGGLCWPLALLLPSASGPVGAPWWEAGEPGWNPYTDVRECQPQV